MLELFLIPGLNGLCFAMLLPVLGCYLRLRDEWLAALAYPHVAASGALGSLAIGAPLALGGVLSAVLCAVAKRAVEQRLAHNVAFALLMLIGWASAILLTANLPMAERLGHALFDGQLYLSSRDQIAYSLLLMILGLLSLRSLSKPMLRARIFPETQRSHGMRAWGLALGFDLLSAAILAGGTMTMGVMGVFALIFVPAWAAFLLARNWRGALGLAVAVSVFAYAIAFAIALHLDQAFGPVLALALVVCGTLATFVARIARWQGKC